MLFPVAFVSEHSETLVELDIEYRELAHRSGVPAYHRVATVGVQPAFIDGLAELVLRTLAEPAQAVCNDGSMPACDSRFPTCLMRAS